MVASALKRVMQRTRLRSRKLIRLYTNVATRRPFVTSSVSAGFILFAADTTAQWIGGNREWDRQRTLGLTMFGILYYGFPCKAIYLMYDKVLGEKRVLTKMFVDCCIHTPFCLIPVFYALTGVIKGQGAHEWQEQLKREWVTASFGSVMYWTPVQLVCFRYVPQHSRVQFVSTMSFFHKAWLSWLSNRGRVKERRETSTIAAKVEGTTPTLIEQQETAEVESVTPSTVARLASTDKWG